MRGATVAVVAMFMAVAVSGCGGGADSPDYTSKAVIEHFKEQTGDLLIRGTSSTQDYEALDLGEGTDPATGEMTAEGSANQDKYGAFTIYVATADPKKTVNELLQPSGRAGEKLEGPDTDGVYWSRSCPGDGLPCYWVAEKKFGNNVLLSWIADKKKTDDRFTKLSSILTDLPSSS